MEDATRQEARSGGVQEGEEFRFSLVRRGPLRRLGPLLATPAQGPMRVLPRAIALTLLAWVPLAVGAHAAGRAFSTQWSDPLTRHLSIHVQLLLVLPILVVSESWVDRVMRRVLRGFKATGIVDGANGAQFGGALRRAERLRDSWWGVAFVAAVVLVRLAYSLAVLKRLSVISWAQTPPDTAVSGAPFAAWWYLVVCRSVLAALAAAWAWRLITAWGLFRWISKVDLHLVPTHPDRLAGLGFLQSATKAAVPIVFAAGALVAAPMGRAVSHEGASVMGLPLPIAVFVGIVLAVMTGPMFQFSGRLRAAKRRALREYGGLVARQGRLVHRKWIEGGQVDDEPLLDAPELGPVADTNAMYEAVRQMRTVPMGKQAVLPLAAAALLPFVPIVAQAIPLKDAFKQVLGMLL
jgi:hypothetical protein